MKYIFATLMFKSRFIVSLFSAIFSFLFLMAGTGFNIIHYCCGSCATKGIDYIAHHSCHEVHGENACCQSDNQQDKGLYDISLMADYGLEICSEQDNHCDVERVHVDEFSISKNLALSSLDIDYQTINLILTYASFQPLVENHTRYLSNPPPNFSLHDGREILCNKAVLII